MQATSLGALMTSMTKGQGGHFRQDRPFDDDAVLYHRPYSGLGHQYGDGRWSRLGQLIAVYIAVCLSPVQSSIAWDSPREVESEDGEGLASAWWRQGKAPATRRPHHARRGSLSQRLDRPREIAAAAGSISRRGVPSSGEPVSGERVAIHRRRRKKSLGPRIFLKSGPDRLTIAWPRASSVSPAAATPERHGRAAWSRRWPPERDDRSAFRAGS